MAERARETRLSAWLRAPGARPFVLGHRGARESAPENSERAFELALDEGADGVELDVRLDGDGRVIVLHDAELGRVSSGSETRAAEELGAAELARVDLGGGERVPLLVDVLRVFRDRGARVNVELKRDVRRPTALLRGVERAVRESGAPPELVDFFELSSGVRRGTRAPPAGLPSRMARARAAARRPKRPALPPDRQRRCPPRMVARHSSVGRALEASNRGREYLDGE